MTWHWRAAPLIEMRVEVAPDAPTIMANESEVREALINLVFNAADALPDGGRITLRVRRQAADAQFAKPAVVVEVIDDGVGMDENTRIHCLEPFFTTKGERGTGLGLAMVYGIAQRHDAELQVDSEPGKGTTIRLLFPDSAGAAVMAQQREVPQAVRGTAASADRRRSADPAVAAQCARIRRAPGDLCARRTGRHRHVQRCPRPQYAVLRGHHRPGHAARRWPPGGNRNQEHRAHRESDHADRLGAVDGGWH